MAKKISKFFLVASFVTLLILPARAHAVTWFPIVPCGLNQQPAGIAKTVHDYTQPCNQCLLLELGKNIIDMTFFAIVPTVGTLMFLIAGFIILFNARSGNSGGVGKGKEIMTNTAIGIAIILGAWLITNFILKSLAVDEIAGTPWYQIQCKTGTLGEVVGGSPTPTPIPTSTATPTPTSSKTPTPTPGTTRTPTPTPTSSTTPTPTGGVQCLQSGLNLCQGDSSVGCANASCGQYAAMIQRQASGAATANVLKAFMEVESSCNIAAATGTSYGLMQMTPPIPQIYASRCGVSATDVNRAWLTNPTNAEKSICISVQWINALAASQCGSSIRNLYAGYNGGQNGACAPSVSCAGEKSCSNEPMKRWECLYDDVAHTQCNGGNGADACLIPTRPGQKCGYNQTRQGATRIQYCATNPGF